MKIKTNIQTLRRIEREEGIAFLNTKRVPFTPNVEVETNSEYLATRLGGQILPNKEVTVTF